jgi:hypothetical protein
MPQRSQAVATMRLWLASEPSPDMSSGRPQGRQTRTGEAGGLQSSSAIDRTDLADRPGDPKTAPRPVSGLKPREDARLVVALGRTPFAGVMIVAQQGRLPADRH